MAGDWIKMRTDLGRDPAVIQLSEHYGWQEHVIVGLLHKVWSWADEQCANGNAPSVTETFIDRYVGVTGWAEQMQRVGWLEVHKEGEVGISFPNWERHMSKSAKRRALTTNRVRNARSVTEALPEKRREEKSIKKKVLKKSGKDDDGDYSDAFEAFWESFSVERRTKKPDAWRAWVQWECEAISEKLISASELYAKSTEGRGDYCQGPGPWLDAKRWQDYQPPEKPKLSASQERQENEARRVRIIKEGRSRGMDEDVIDSALQKAGLDEL